jgi:hypothetical protein
MVEGPNKPRRLLEDEDIVCLLQENERDYVAVRQVHDYLDDGGDKAIRAMYRACASLPTLWSHPSGRERKGEENGQRRPTICQFWRYAQLVGLTHLASLSELSRVVVASRAAASTDTPVPLRKLSIYDFALGIATIAAERTTCAVVMRLYGLGKEDGFLDRLAALIQGISSRQNFSIATTPTKSGRGEVW